LLIFDLSGGLSNPGLEDCKVKSQSTKIAIIAIVEDDDPLRDALESILRAAGFLVDKFSSAESFLESADRQETSCLILDIRLPGMNGIELQQRLRDASFAVPIIFVTAHGDASIRDTVMRAGAAGFLTKPVRSETLLASIRAAMGRTAPAR
jgi:FixJ family two-component response regulator